MEVALCERNDLLATRLAAPCLAYGQRAVRRAPEVSPALPFAVRRTEHMCAPLPLQQGGRPSSGRLAAQAANRGPAPKIHANRAASARRKAFRGYSTISDRSRSRTRTRSPGGRLLSSQPQFDHHPLLALVIDEEVAMEKNAAVRFKVRARNGLAPGAVGIERRGP